jgi:hypothetical protein
VKSQPVVPAVAGPANEPPTSEAPGAVDWGLEAEAAAGRQLAKDEEARRLAKAFGHEFKDSTQPPNHAKDFAWSRAHTHRIEPLEGGGTFIHLNDRCGIVFMVMVLPVCQLGKIEARGDLFEGLKDPPVLGTAPKEILP